MMSIRTGLVKSLRRSAASVILLTFQPLTVRVPVCETLTMVTRAKPRAAQKLDTRERIRRAAWELFTTKGYEETTTKAVAKRAGVAAGTVFVHASDKADLLFLVMHDRLAGAVDRQLASLPEGPLLARLLHVFSGLFRMYGEHPGVARAFLAAIPGARGPNGQRVDALTFAFLFRIAQLVRDAQEAGELARDVDPQLAARNVFALYYASLLAWLSGYVPLDAALDPGLKDALALQVRGLAKRR